MIEYQKKKSIFAFRIKKTLSYYIEKENMASIMLKLNS